MSLWRRHRELSEASLVGAQDLKCADSLLGTSNPPKWEITFRLDDTRYVALVVITDDPPRLTPVR